MLNKIIKYFLENKLITVLILITFIVWGVSTSPFNWNTGFLPKDPVPVDAIPDLGENQQIVFTEWPGRSPQDIEDQITYPLTTSLLGIPNVKSIRSTSMFGFSSIYIIFEEKVDFYWSRSRVLEKLNSLQENLLPDDAKPALGPDATALGQVYWYTIEGRDEKGHVTGGWDLDELRSVQDYYVKYALNGVSGVSEVASVGGYVKEYQIDVNPDALKAYNIGIDMVMMAVKNSNRDIGAKTIEINKAEYFIRGLGYIKSIQDLENTVVSVTNNKPILIKDVAHVSLGPATRRGVLDKGGAEVVGGVVVARYGSNPLEVINNVKAKITEFSPGLPKKTLADGTISQLTIVPFYDRTHLIEETISTLETALFHEILISIIVVLVLMMNLRASFIISSLLPVGVLMTFIIMRYAGVDANVVALSGIAIAIGVMVDIGIVFVENIIRHLEMPENEGVKGKELMNVIYVATKEVASAITTALATTVVSFIPVFAMVGAEGKLFRPLAFTKTFALLGAFVLGIVVLPALAHFVFGINYDKKKFKRTWGIILIVGGLLLAIYMHIWLPLVLWLLGLNSFLEHKIPLKFNTYSNYINIGLTLFIATFFLAEEWMPLGPQNYLVVNYLFVLVLIGSILGTLLTIVHFYEPVLKWCLNNKGKFMLIPLFTLLFGVFIWIGFDSTFKFASKGFEKMGWSVKETKVWSSISKTFPGIGSEFMPTLNEGSFLLMPTSMPHAGLEESKNTVQKLDMLLANIPEVDMAVGKLGRVESAIDPAPISMFENIINYKPEFIVSEDGKPKRFKVDKDDKFILANGTSLTNDDALVQSITEKDLLPDDDGEFFRNWRSHIKSSDDIWKEIVKVTNLPGVTSAPKLQPIETRLVMLQTGMRAPMGIKVYGPDLKTIQDFGLELEGILKQVPSVKAEAVFADRIVGKPYLQLNINRSAIARYGLSVEKVQQIIETAVGGMKTTSTVEGRERYPVRVRYPRELRNDPEKIKKILVPTPTGVQVPLGELISLEFVRGPQMIKSEETFLVGYVLFDKKENFAEVDVVNDAQKLIKDKIDTGELIVPKGVNYKFSGSYENQIRAVKKLSIVIPISLIVIFLLLYFQFKTVIASSIHFSGVFVAFAGGFIMLWLYGQDWFLNFSIADVNMRHLFQIHPINLSVAVWVGFIALFGIATDDGVIMGTYIHQVFEEKQPKTILGVREAVLEAGKKRVRPAMMTAAVAIIALLPVLTSTGKGADIMIPMAIPTFGGMIIQLMTMFVVPVLQAFWRESVIKKKSIMRLINKKKLLNMKYLFLVVLLYSASLNSQTLNDYLEIALQNNPEIKAAYSEFEAALQKAPQVSSLPDPSLTMSAFGRMIETRVGAQEARFSLMQMFPWFGTLTAKEDAANLMAEATFQKYLDSRNEVFLEIKKSYAEIYEINKMIQLEEKNLQILDDYRELGLSKFKNGKGAMVDVVRIDIKRNESETNIQLLKDQNQPLQIEFNSLLNRDLDEMINIPDSLPLAENKMILEKDSLFVSNPKLIGLDKKMASFEAQKKVVKKEGYPMIGLGLDYSIISKRDVPNLEMNGQDAIMPMLSVTLPVFRKKYNAMRKEVDFMLQATNYEKQAVNNNLQTTYSMATYNVSKAKTLKELYKKQTESTQQAISLLIAAYSNSGTDFEEILRMNQDLLMLKTASVSANKNQFIAQSTIDYLISKQE